MVQEEHTKIPGAEGKNQQPKEPHKSLGENIENLFADLFGIVLRYFYTVLLFSLMPVRAAQSVLLQQPNYRKVMRPYTYLFIGCLLYSFLLGAISNIGESNYAELVVKVAKEAVWQEFSYTNLLLRSLPLVIIISLFATIAGFLNKTGGEALKTLLVYLYGLQGCLLLIITLIIAQSAGVFIESLGDLKYIKYLIFAFLLLVLSMGVQGFRSFHRVVKESIERQKSRILLFLVFPLLFYVPLPLAGYVVVWTGLIPNEVKQEPIERRVAPVRIVKTKSVTIESGHANILLTALIQNTSKFPFLITANNAYINLNLVSENDIRTLFQGVRDTYQSLKKYKRYMLVYKSVIAEITTSIGTSEILLPGEAIIVEVTFDVKGSSVHFMGDWDAERKRYISNRKSENLNELWNELAKNRLLFLRMSVKDPTLNIYLESDYSRARVWED